MTAPRSDHGTALQHWFSKKGWSQHSETVFKVHLPNRVIKIPKSSPWPTDYLPVMSYQVTCATAEVTDSISPVITLNLPGLCHCLGPAVLRVYMDLGEWDTLHGMCWSECTKKISGTKTAH